MLNGNHMKSAMLEEWEAAAEAHLKESQDLPLGRSRAVLLFFPNFPGLQTRTKRSTSTERASKQLEAAAAPPTKTTLWLTRITTTNK